MVVRAFRNLGLPEDRLPEELEEIMSQGLQRIYAYQQQDGSWGWWYDDDSSLYQTTYVIYGLVMTKQAGYQVDEGVLERGIAATERLLAQATEPRTRAYALYVLSVAGQGDLAAAQELLSNKEQLDYFAQAALALALFEQQENDSANELIDDLVAAAVETTSTAHWPQSDSDGAYARKAMASTTRATALVLEALTQIRPENPLLSKTARWLMDKRLGTHWRTTQETAYAILGLASYIQISGELAPDYRYEIYLNDDLLSSGVVSASNALEPIPMISVPSDLLADGDNQVRILKQGRGLLYYALTLRASHLSDADKEVPPAGNGISVSRRYQRLDDRNQTSENFAVGDLIKVHLTVEATSDAWYVIIEDPLPAGAEALNERLNTTSYNAEPGGGAFGWRSYGYNRKEVHDDRVALFVTRLRAGRHEYDYLMRATTPGQFSVLPTQVYLMYDPDIWARSASQRCQIDMQQVEDPLWRTGDFDRDCRVTDFDLKQVVVPWNTLAGESNYDPARDLDQDGDIDVMDVTQVAINWGTVCSDAPQLATLEEHAPSAQVEPALTTVTAGDTFTVAVRMQDQALTFDGYQFRLNFDPTLLRVNHVASSQADIADRANIEILGPQIDHSAGQLTYGAFHMGHPEATKRHDTLSGSPPLAVITFTALKDGQAHLALDAIQGARTGEPRKLYLPLIFK